MKTVAWRVAWLVGVGALWACGPKPHPITDAGEEDAGVDAGIDAGRQQGDNPPVGYSQAVVLPGDGGTNRLGPSLSLALDQFDQPMVAFVHQDPNGDGVMFDTRLLFTRWNGVAKKWQDHKTIETIGPIDNAAPHRQVSLTRDTVTGQLGVAYLNANNQIRFGWSDDEGDNWSLVNVSAATPTGQRSDPVLLMRDGAVYVAYAEAEHRCAVLPGCDAVMYAARAKGATTFTSEQVPPAPSFDGQVRGPIAGQLDAAGHPGFAFLSTSSASTVLAVTFWRPGISTAGEVVRSGGIVDPGASVSLAFRGELPSVAFHLKSVAATNAQLFYAAAQDAAGTVWGTPVGIPRNNLGSPEGTHFFQALGIDGNGRIAIAANFDEATAQPQQCGGPKFATSTDGVTFTTCSPDNGVAFGYSGLWVNLAVAKNNKWTLAFLYEVRTRPVAPGGGIILWREQ